jgi:hypothetical protein
VRGRAQHHPGPVRLIQRSALPGAPFVGQHDAGHRCAERGWLRRRRRAGLLLCRHELRDHHHLRPVGPQQPPDPGAPRLLARPRRRRLRQPRRRQGGPDHHRRPEGLRRLHRTRNRLPQQPHQRHRHRRPARGHLRGRRRPALQPVVLLRLWQRADGRPSRLPSHHGDRVLRGRQAVGLGRRQRSLGDGRPGVGAVLRREGGVQPESDHQPALRHRHGEGRAGKAAPSPVACRPFSTGCGPAATTR